MWPNDSDAAWAVSAGCERVPDLVLALGVVSAPDYHARRMAQRHSWMRFPEVGRFVGAAVCSSFVVRAGGAPRRVEAALSREAIAHGDTLLVPSVAYNETRVRGPLLSLAWWLAYAQRTMKHARWVGKLDDDAYLHAPDLARLLMRSREQLGAQAAVYMGVMTWYHCTRAHLYILSKAVHTPLLYHRKLLRCVLP